MCARSRRNALHAYRRLCCRARRAWLSSVHQCRAWALQPSVDPSRHVHSARYIHRCISALTRLAGTADLPERLTADELGTYVTASGRACARAWGVLTSSAKLDARPPWVAEECAVTLELNQVRKALLSGMSLARLNRVLPRFSACMMWVWPACTGCSGITSSCDRYPQPWPTSCTGCNLFFVRQADVVIVVAGMDGALPGVVGGLVSVPVIAVPTSIGYGASFEVHFLCCILSFRCNVSYCWC